MYDLEEEQKYPHLELIRVMAPAIPALPAVLRGKNDHKVHIQRGSVHVHMMHQKSSIASVEKSI